MPPVPRPARDLLEATLHGSFGGSVPRRHWPEHRFAEWASKTPTPGDVIPGRGLVTPPRRSERFATEGLRNADRGLEVVFGHVGARQNRRRGDLSKAVAYLRVSTTDQHLGPEAQRKSIETWAAANGVQVVAWHADPGVSGGSDLDDRPGLVAALAELRLVGAGVLVVAKRDRLARDVYEIGRAHV